MHFQEISFKINSKNFKIYSHIRCDLKVNRSVKLLFVQLEVCEKTSELMNSVWESMNRFLSLAL